MNVAVLSNEKKKKKKKEICFGFRLSSCLRSQRIPGGAFVCGKASPVSHSVQKEDFWFPRPNQWCYFLLNQQRIVVGVPRLLQTEPHL